MGAIEAEMPIVNKIASAMVCVTATVFSLFVVEILIQSSYCTLPLSTVLTERNRLKKDDHSLESDQH